MPVVQTPNLFLRQLSAIVNLVPNSPPNWTSENDFDVRTIGLEDGQTIGWVPERDKKGQRAEGEMSRPVDYISSQYAVYASRQLTGKSLLQNGQLQLLAYLFGQCPDNRQAVYKRPNPYDEGIIDLYLLVRFRTEWIGLKTQVVES